MERAGDHAGQPPKRRGVVEPSDYLTAKGVTRYPTKGTEKTSARHGSRFSKLESSLQAYWVATLERQRCYDEKLAWSAVLIELSPRDREAGLSSYANPVDMSFDAFFESREMTQGIVWLLGRRVPQTPKERGFFGVLLDDVRNDRRRRGSVEPRSVTKLGRHA